MNLAQNLRLCKHEGCTTILDFSYKCMLVISMAYEAVKKFMSEIKGR